MATEFGIYVKQIRGKESLRTMSAKLGITPAFLSAMETGKKSIPMAYWKKISDLYELTEEQETELFQAICRTNGHIDIDVKDMSTEQLEICGMFSRKIDNMSIEKIEEIKNILYA